MHKGQIVAMIFLKLILHFLSFFLISCFCIFQTIFQITPLNVVEWMAVMKISIPVIILDETLKFIARKFTDGKNTSYFELACIMLVWGVYIPLAVKSM